ncbi:MAG: acyl-CoA thioesterase [Steroidobacteraceae bacterium]
MSAPDADWDLPGPHVVVIDVQPGDIDEYRHVNNAVYMQWLDRAAWSHATSFGMSPDVCLATRRGMVVHRAELDYERAALAGDTVGVATWVVASDLRLRATRRFQVRRARDGVTLLRARIDYVCTNLESGRATRMPESFAAGFRSVIRS